MSNHKGHTEFKYSVLGSLIGTGYMLWVLQWFFMVLLYMQEMTDSGIGRMIFPKPSLENIEQTKPIIEKSQPLLPESVVTILCIIGVICLFGFAIHAVIKSYIPSVKKTAEKAVMSIAREAVEKTVVHKHRKMSVKKKLILTNRVAFWIRLVVSLVPLAVVLIFDYQMTLIPKTAAIFLLSLLSLLAVLTFTLHKALSNHWRIKYSTDNA